MILRLFSLVVLIALTFAHPRYQQTIKIPDLEVLSPEEVNSLDHHHETRSISNPSPQQTVNNIEDTIKEVEGIIKSNPALPRLTRGEIMDLLDNITKGDAEQQKRDPKAIMVVMPFTPNSNDASNMEDLYTKMPVTHIIGAEPFKKAEVDKVTIPRKPQTTTKPIVRTQGTRRTTESPTTYRPPTSKILSRRRRPLVTSDSSTLPPVAATTYRPRLRSTTFRQIPTTTRHPNHKYPEPEEVKINTPSNVAFKVIEAPQFVPTKSEENISDLDLMEDTQSEVLAPIQIPPKRVKKPVYQKPAPIKFEEEINVPQHLRPVMAAMNLDTILNAGSAEPSNPKLQTIDEAEKIKTMLASIGILFPSSTTTTTEAPTTSVPDVHLMADNLTPEMKELLMSFGLIPNPNENPETLIRDGEAYIPPKAEVKPESYGGFKPLPEDTATRNDMEDLLASFGLLRGSRSEKSLRYAKPELNFDMIPEEYKHVISDIGLDQEHARKLEPSKKKTEQKNHIFSPAKSEFASEEELGKLNKLMDVIKQLEKLNGTATEEDLKTIDLEGLKDLVGSLNAANEDMVPLDEQKNPPNPLNYDNGLIKNEVKRQESTSTTTEEAKTPSIKDLEDSFGGSAASESATEATLPDTTTPRKTGFYYLLDWNTFLDIDDQKGKRVNLRFQPKVGDAKRFLSVNVP